MPISEYDCRDYARDGETALVASRRDVADLTARLERLAVDGALRGRIAKGGAAFVTTAFDWGRAVRRMEEILAAGAAAGGGQARRRA